MSTLVLILLIVAGIACLFLIGSIAAILIIRKKQKEREILLYASREKEQ